MRTFILILTMLELPQVLLHAQPTITQQPTNQVLASGATLTLSVTTSDPLAAYQWFKDNRLILGATNSALMVTNVGASDTGTYFVVATNGSGMIISVPALVSVGNPALLAWGYDQYGQLGDGQSGSLGTSVKQTTPELIIANTVTATGGDAHSLFVTADGTLWAMGLNSSGQLGDGTTTMRTSPVPVIGGSNVVAVAGGFRRSLVLKNDGTVWAMGGGFSSTPNSVASNAVAVAGGLQPLFLKSDGTLWTASSSPTPISGASNVVVAAAENSQTLFLRSDGTLWTTSSSTPISGASNVVAIAAGSAHALFVTSDGTLWAMGNNQYGQLGDGTTTTRNNPVPVIGGTNAVTVVAGSQHSLFMRSDGTLWAMGENNDGQLGNGTTANQSTPVPVSIGAVSVAGIYSGSLANHSFAIGQPAPQSPSVTTQATMPVSATNATLNGMALPNGLPATAWFEWGPLGSYAQTTVPVDVGSGYTVVRVSALISGLSNSNVYQCRLVASNSVGVSFGAVQWFRVDNAPKISAWGDNEYGQLQVPQNLTNVVAVAGGGAFYSVALQADGTIHDWGYDYQSPGIPASATNVVALGIGRGIGTVLNLALRSDGTVVNWEASGNLTPPPLKNVVAVAVGDTQGLALEAGGQLVAWPIYSGNQFGQSTVPPGLTNVVAISCGAAHDLVLLANGTVAAWGYNDDGETNVPPNATNVVAIAAGSYHNLVLRADGTVVAWGDDGAGQSDVPAGLSNVVAIAGGGFHSLVLKSDGTVVAWGGGGWPYGQATVPLGLSNVVAIAACGFHSLVLGGNVPPVVDSQTNSGSVNQDLVIAPTVSDANNDTLICRVATLPAQGALYQYDGGARGPQITAPDTMITDPSDRVIFAPAPNANGSPYTTFSLVANDGEADSAPATMTINIFNAPQNFAASSIGGANGQQLTLQLTGTPNYPYIVEMATNLTPPVIWQPILTNPADLNGNWSWTLTNLSDLPAGFYRAVVTP